MSSSIRPAPPLCSSDAPNQTARVVTQSGVTRWTNPSVLRFAEQDDPITKMENRVREIVLKARDAGWSGPPFNPVTLARHLQIPVDPTSSVVDARTVSGPEGLRIQYNPQQARERARFSIAHEIAHTLFEDVADATRHRGGDPTSTDDWQLEMLCNFAAAEIVMPAGSLPPLTHVPPIEELLKDRLRFDVSVEAYLMRVTKAAESPLTMFVASPRRQGGRATYSLDYAVSSPSAPRVTVRGKTIPEESAVLHCTAIGATSHGAEDWFGDSPARLEAVGIPGLPGSNLTRVAALVRHSETSANEPIHYVQGDVLQPRPLPPQIICQVVNDKATRWGGGVARQSAKKYPQAEQEFSEWMKEVPKADRLGDVHYARISDTLTLASMIAQEGYGPGSSARIRYWALDRALEAVASYAQSSGASVHMPRIGTGGAQGDWTVIESMIRMHFAELPRGVWVYDPPPQLQSDLGF